jgi:hypothetical protein
MAAITRDIKQQQQAHASQRYPNQHCPIPGTPLRMAL